MSKSSLEKQAKKNKKRATIFKLIGGVILLGSVDISAQPNKRADETQESQVVP